MEIDRKHYGVWTGNLNPFSLQTEIPTAHIEAGLFFAADAVEGSASPKNKSYAEMANAISCFFEKLSSASDPVIPAHNNQNDDKESL